MKHLISGAALAASAAIPTTTLAHAVFSQPEQQAGQTVELAIRIGHGCDGYPTRRVEVTLPNGPGVSPAVTGAQPRHTRDWRVDTETGPAEAFSNHEETFYEDVRRMTWSLGLLPDSEYELYEFRVTLPALPAGARPLRLAFPTVQKGVRGERRWLGEDAPRLTITPPEQTPANHH